MGFPAFSSLDEALVISLLRRNVNNVAFGLHRFLPELFASETIERAAAALSLLDIVVESMTLCMRFFEVSGDELVGVGK